MACTALEGKEADQARCSSDGSASSSTDLSRKASRSSCVASGKSSVGGAKLSGGGGGGGGTSARRGDGRGGAGKKGRVSSSSAASDGNESICSTCSSASNKPHKANDPRWEAIQALRARAGDVDLSHFRLLRRLGCGDIGSVYLSELRGSSCFFAMKVMDKGSLATRKKLLRTETERHILQSLDHPFLPTLYAHFETDKFSCLVMEFCSGGDLHTLRQHQQGKHFSEQAARFYAAEVLLAMQYLHMLGVVYRDLKPENVLVREDGHIMLADFDLSLRCTVSPTLVKSPYETDGSRRPPAYCAHAACIEPACVVPPCIAPPCIRPARFIPRLFPQRLRLSRKPRADTGSQAASLPELVAEPTGMRSMSFVGTHEYLAPEIIRGDGHGSPVDWWAFGIFLYELLHGKTPFKGSGNRATLVNVVGQPLRFPDTPIVSYAARDLIRGLLAKDPQHRLASKRGAAEIKQHPFFEDVNWALIRSACPPDVPGAFEARPAGRGAAAGRSGGASSGSYLDFEFF